MAEEEIQEAEAPVDEGEAGDIPQEAPVEQPETDSAQEAGDVWNNFRTMEQFQGQEDAVIAQRLYEAMQREEHASKALQQYQSAVPVVQDYLNNRNEYEAWKASQSQPQQQPQPQAAPAPQQEQSWWNPPTLKDSHKRYLTRDENGREVIREDAPLDARAALEDYMTYRADFAQKFLDNPEAALGGMVEKIAAQRAESIMEARIGQLHEEQYVTGLEAENKDWLYDEQGNVSAEGLAVQKYISDAKSIGINGPQARWDFATKMVERDLLLQAMQRQQQQQQAPAPQQPVQQAPQQQQSDAQQNMEYLRNQAMRTASQRSAATTTARVPEKSMTFNERLLAAAQDQGMF